MLFRLYFFLVGMPLGNHEESLQGINAFAWLISSFLRGKFEFSTFKEVTFTYARSFFKKSILSRKTKTLSTIESYFTKKNLNTHKDC